MAYFLYGKITVFWQGDGAGPGMSLAPSAQSLSFDNLFSNAGGLVQIAGGDTLTQANLAAACATLGANLATDAGDDLAQMVAWSTGGG